ncbi:MAG: NAD(+) diphosphatase [Cytophagales bacterium]|nr:NAD(+) diphosphatase [Armatimonadota bacterium]
MMPFPSVSANVGAFTAGFLRAYPPAEKPAGPTLYLPFRNGELLLAAPSGGPGRLLRDDRPEAALALQTLLPDEDRAVLYLGTLDGMPCATFAVESASESLPSPDLTALGLTAMGLRALYGVVLDAEYGLAGYAAQILRWRAFSRFCPVDGTPTEPVANAWARACPLCGYSSYPPVSPATLILVHDGGDRILLARKPGWGKRYSILAGFVEPGETLEECCYREALEEAGVQTAAFEYGGSQPWPFPHQLMVGFSCRWESGEIRIDETELEHAEWFRFDALPELPPALSLSRQLIDRWVRSRLNLKRAGA